MSEPQDDTAGRAVMEYRMDFVFQKNEPILVGLFIKPFGWIIGGTNSGSLSLKGEISVSHADLNKGSHQLLTKFKKLLRGYDYSVLKRNWRCYG